MNIVRLAKTLLPRDVCRSDGRAPLYVDISQGEVALQGKGPGHGRRADCAVA